MKHRAVSATLVVVMHSTLLWSCATVEPPPPKPAAPADLEVSLVQVRLLPSADGEGDALCDSYRGIGVLHGWGGIITQLAPGGPAERAGARVGDRFVNDFDFGGNRYQVGTVLTMWIERDGEQMALRVTIGNICHERQ